MEYPGGGDGLGIDSKVVGVKGVWSTFFVAAVVIYPAAPADGIIGRDKIDILVGHVRRKMTADEVELRVTVIAPELEPVIAHEGAVLEDGFGVRVGGAIMPDAGGAVVGLEGAVFGPGPAAGTIEIHAAFH